VSATPARERQGRQGEGGDGRREEREAPGDLPGVRNALAPPCSARAAMKTPMSGAKAASTDSAA